MKLIRRMLVVLFAFLSIVSNSYAQESESYSEKEFQRSTQDGYKNTRLTEEFIQAVHNGEYDYAIALGETIDFYFRGDSIDYQLDFSKYESFCYYVVDSGLCSDSTIDRMLGYLACIYIEYCEYYYLQEEFEKASSCGDAAIYILLQLDESKFCNTLVDAFYYKGLLLMEQGDTLQALHMYDSAISLCRTYDIVERRYVECLFYKAVSIIKLTGQDCDLAEVWDECYDVFLAAKKQNKLPNDFFLNESKILFYVVSAYVDCGIKCQWAYQFDEAEDAFLKAIDRNSQRKKFASEPVYGHGNIDQYLVDCRKMRLQVEYQNVDKDIFEGEIRDCYLCTPYQEFVFATVNARYYKEIGDVVQSAASLRKAHSIIKVFDLVHDTLPENMVETYYNLCLSIRKDSLASFLSIEDISAAFAFLEKKYNTTVDSLCLQLTYAISLVQDSVTVSEKILQQVGELLRKNRQQLNESKDFPAAKLLYLATSMALKFQYINKEILSFDTNSVQPIGTYAGGLYDEFELFETIWQDIKNEEDVINNIDVYYGCLTMLVKFSYWLRNEDQVFTYALEYLTARKKYLAQYISYVPDSKRLQWLQSQEDSKAEDELYSIVKDCIDNGDSIPPVLISALYDNELLTNEILLKSALSVPLYLSEVHDKTLSAIYQDLQDKKSRLNESRLRGKNAKLLQDTILQLERVLAENTRTYRIKKIFEESPTWDDVRSALKDNEVAIEFVSFGYQDSYGAFVIRKSMKNPEWIRLDNPFLVDKSIEEQHPYFKYLVSKDRYGYYLHASDSLKNSISHKFYGAIWEPLSAYINEGDVVYYAPKGMLHYFPLQSFADSNGVYLSEKYDLRLVSSTGALVHEKDSEIHSGAAKLYGGIYYDLYTNPRSESIEESTNRSKIQYLPYSKKEVLTIGALCKKNKIKYSILSEDKATEQSIREAPYATIMHFATHTYFQPVISDQSNILDNVGLCLYNANATLKNVDSIIDSSNDGILTASEISLLDFANVDLVVLSACNTGIGEITSDGISGLQRGFKMAGVNSIMMSLWPVDDAATCLLMTEFYKNYLGGKTKNQSLREAQRYLRNYEQDGEKIFADPKYWAAFVLLDALE